MMTEDKKYLLEMQASGALVLHMDGQKVPHWSNGVSNPIENYFTQNIKLSELGEFQEFKDETTSVFDSNSAQTEANGYKLIITTEGNLEV